MLIAEQVVERESRFSNDPAANVRRRARKGDARIVPATQHRWRSPACIAGTTVYLLKRLVKRLLFAAAPGWTLAMLSARARSRSHRIVAEWGSGVVTEKLIARFGSRVQAGPFEGLQLSPMTAAEQLGPFLLGVYESELDAAWETALAGRFERIIDIGAKFGYYAVGLARRYPQTPVIAFDTDWWARKALREMARLNDVSNLEIRGECRREWLATQDGLSALVISDCEGCEETLFTKDVASALRHSVLIIETHDCFVPGISERLRSVFEPTHEVRLVHSDENRREPEAALDFLSSHERTLAAREVRPPQVWLFCLPKSGPNSDLRTKR